MVDLVERIERARAYGFEHDCMMLTERTIHCWANGFPLPDGSAVDALKRILRGEA